MTTPSNQVPEIDIHILDASPADFDVRQRVEALGDAWRITATVTNTAVAPVSAGVRFIAEVAASDPFVLIPGAFYGENRPADNDRVFPRFERGASTAEAHQRLVSDEWHLRADRSAAPVVFLWTGRDEPGLALEADEVGALGEQAIGFRVREGRAQLAVTAPMREYPVRYLGSGDPYPPEVRLHTFTPGESVELSLTVHRLSSDRHDYDRVLRTRHARLKDETYEPTLTLDGAARIAAEGLVKWHFDPVPGVLLETVGFDREVSGTNGMRVDRQAMHVGWVSGIPWATAMLVHAERIGSPEVESAARSVINFCTSELSPSGTFWGVWNRGRGWGASWSRVPHALHARTLGEATDFLVRALAIHDEPAWRAAATSNLDVMVGRQRADGNLGALHDATTGEVLSWSGSAALAWVPALIGASRWDDRYLPAALRAGDYYSQFVEAEYLHGAPEDVDQAPSSEDGYVAVMAYMALFRATGEPRWLSLARRAAEWTFTYRYDYNVEFAPQSLLGRYGFLTRGADQASSSNQHIHAYGLICTDELLELSEVTGDPWYRTRAEETLACFRQFVAEVDGDYNAYRGMITERYYQTDCFQPKGMVLTLAHAWSAGVLLLGCEQAIARAAGPRTTSP